MSNLSTLSIAVLAGGVALFLVILAIFIFWKARYDGKSPKPRPNSPSEVDTRVQGSAAQTHLNLPPIPVLRDSAASTNSTGDYVYIEGARVETPAQLHTNRTEADKLVTHLESMLYPRDAQPLASGPGDPNQMTTFNLNVENHTKEIGAVASSTGTAPEVPSLANAPTSDITATPGAIIENQTNPHSTPLGISSINILGIQLVQDTVYDNKDELPPYPGTEILDNPPATIFYPGNASPHDVTSVPMPNELSYDKSVSENATASVNDGTYFVLEKIATEDTNKPYHDAGVGSDVASHGVYDLARTETRNPYELAKSGLDQIQTVTETGTTSNRVGIE